MFSAMITAPSTMMPKSIAPIESKPMGMSGQVHQHQGEQQREGDRQRHQRGHRRPAQEKQQHQHHQRDAQQHAVRDGVQRALDEVRAVVERHDLDALRQDRGCSVPRRPP